LKPFDRSLLSLRPLAERRHDLDLSVLLPLEERPGADPRWETVAARILAARSGGAPVILMMGGHVVRSGVQRHLADLMERGLVTCLAMNGSCVIHDFELALVGATTESVARYIAEGQFGLWEETGRINQIVNAAHGLGGIGYGEAVGREIAQGDYPHRETSLLARAWCLGVPATVHIGIGYDIIHEHPSFDGAAAGALSYRDFLTFAGVVASLDGGVVMAFGSAVMAPEVFLKALAMARNAARREGGSISFTSVVGDLHDLPPDTSREPSRDQTGYYFRPWKTLLARTTAGGGEGFYFRGPHAETIPALWTALRRAGA
jgi:hypothetical protein